MVCETEDPSAVTLRIEREMRYAREARESREEAEAWTKSHLAVKESRPAESAATLQVMTPSETEVQDKAETSFRHGRLGVGAVIVLILFWAWIQERRSARKERGVQNGRYGQ